MVDKVQKIAEVLAEVQKLIQGENQTLFANGRMKSIEMSFTPKGASVATVVIASQNDVYPKFLRYKVWNEGAEALVNREENTQIIVLADIRQNKSTKDGVTKYYTDYVINTLWVSEDGGFRKVNISRKGVENNQDKQPVEVKK